MKKPPTFGSDEAERFAATADHTEYDLSHFKPVREFARKAAALREELRQRYGLFSDSAELIREDREARG